jgi:hypothetical protein
MKADNSSFTSVPPCFKGFQRFSLQMAIYATLGIFLLLAARNPAAHRSLIAFAAWSSFAHAAIMGTLGFEIPELRTGFLIASAILVGIGVVLIALAPTKQAAAQASASGT